MSTFGKQFLSAIVAEGSVSSLVKFGPIDHLFRATEIEAYQYVKAFIVAHGKLPTTDTIAKHTGEILGAAAEPASYYFEQMGNRHVDLELRSGMKTAHTLLTQGQPNPDGALEQLMTTVAVLVAAKFGRQVMDFREAYDLVMSDYTAKWTGNADAGLRLGWPTLDNMTGGLIEGDVLSMVGNTGAGKTWAMLYAALHGWLKGCTDETHTQDESRLIVSLEVGTLPVLQRLSSILTHLPMNHIKGAVLGDAGLKRLKKGLTEIKGYKHPLYVVDGNLTATIEDIAMLARQLKPAGIFIDGGYLVRNHEERDMYRAVAANMRLIKSELAPMAPTIVSWQFAKSANKKDKSKGEMQTLDDIGSSIEIAQISSVVLALLQPDSVETLKQRKIDILKGRNGETGVFHTKWDFDRSDFTEVEQVSPEDLLFN